MHSNITTIVSCSQRVLATLLILLSFSTLSASEDIDPNEAIELVAKFYRVLTSVTPLEEDMASTFQSPSYFHDGVRWLPEEMAVDGIWNYVRTNKHLFLTRDWATGKKNPANFYENAVKGFGYFAYRNENKKGQFYVIIYSHATHEYVLLKTLRFPIVRDPKTNEIRILWGTIFMNGVMLDSTVDYTKIDLNGELGFLSAANSGSEKKFLDEPLSNEVLDPNEADIISEYGLEPD